MEWHNQGVVQSHDQSKTRMYLITRVICHCYGSIMRKALTGTDVSLEWTHGSKLCDLDYADDIVLLDSSCDRMQSMTEAVENEGRKVGLIMNNKKCKVMVLTAWEDSKEIKIEGSAVDTVEVFCYLGSYMSNNGKCDKDYQTRIGKDTSVFGISLLNDI